MQDYRSGFVVAVFIVAVSFYFPLTQYHCCGSIVLTTLPVLGLRKYIVLLLFSHKPNCIKVITVPQTTTHRKKV